MDLAVLTPDKKIFEGKITSVKVPGTNGLFQVLKNHAPIVASLAKGPVAIVVSSGEHQVYDTESGDIVVEDKPGRTISFEIENGFIEVLNNNVSLLVSGVDGFSK